MNGPEKILLLLLVGVVVVAAASVARWQWWWYCYSTTPSQINQPTWLSWEDMWWTITFII